MMKLRRQSRRRRVKAEMNVVPYIDVMLVLLVIFMIAAPLINQSVEIDLPQAQTQHSEQSNDNIPPLVLSVDRQGQYYLNWSESAAALTESQVIEIVQTTLAQYPDLAVFVRGDVGASYAQVFNGITLLRDGGVPKVGLSTQPSSAQTTPQ